MSYSQIEVSPMCYEASHRKGVRNIVRAYTAKGTEFYSVYGRSQSSGLAFWLKDFKLSELDKALSFAKRKAEKHDAVLLDETY